MVSGHQRAPSAGRTPGRNRADTRPASLALASALAAIAILTAAAGCGSHSSVSYSGVCENARTHVRVADRRCAASPSAAPTSAQYPAPFQWVFYGSGQTAPAIGSKSSGGTPKRPGDGANVVEGGVPAEGGVVSGTSGSGDGSGGGDGGSGGEGGEGGGGAGK